MSFEKESIILEESALKWAWRRSKVNSVIYLRTASPFQPNNTWSRDRWMFYGRCTLDGEWRAKEQFHFDIVCSQGYIYFIHFPFSVSYF